MGSTVGLSIFNASILYSTLIMPIYTAQATAVFMNPLFLIPSLLTNFYIWRRSSNYFFGDRAQVVNLFLKPNGKQIIVETRDGHSKIVNNSDIYENKLVETRFFTRIDFYHGANNHCYITGSSHIFDSWTLTQVLEKNFIDTKNIDSEFAISKDFTWEAQDLVDIKKRKRVVDRVIKPTCRNLIRQDSTAKRRYAIKSGTILTSL